MMNRNLLLSTTALTWLLGCSVADEPGTVVKSDPSDIKVEAAQVLQQENVESPSEKDVSRVVIDAPPSEHEATESAQEVQTTVAGATPEEPKRREEKIRGIVNKALADTPPEHAATPEILPTTDESSSTQQEYRKKRLDDAMINAGPPKDSPGDTYIAELNEEVSTTVVIDVESARLPAVVSSSTHSDPAVRQPVKLVSNEDFLVYTVQSGDSLWAIAEYFYGDGFRYTDIFEANRDLIERTNLLEIGQALRIPKPGTIRGRSIF